MITDADLDRKAASQAKLIDRWIKRCRALVDEAIDNAAAHATKALTDTLKAKPDGRRTIRHANRSRSLSAAAARLSGLLDALAGPSVDSVEGLVRIAWVDAYADALRRWANLIPGEHLRPDPTVARSAELTAVRRLALHGTELRKELSGPIEAANRSLASAVAQAAGRSTPESVASDLIDGWARRAKHAIGEAVTTAIMDGCYRADVASGWHAFRPELRQGESPLESA